MTDTHPLSSIPYRRIPRLIEELRPRLAGHFLACEGRYITEKKAQEGEIAEKNIELQGLLERIRELDEIKTQFFANVSHELRTPLALILGPAQRLIESGGTMQPAQRRDAGAVVARNAAAPAQARERSARYVSDRREEVERRPPPT